MKRNALLFILILFFTLVMVGCKKDRGGAPLPVEGLKAFPGKYRAKVEFTAPADARSGKVFFGGGNFKEFTVDDPAAMQEVIVEDLPEGEQRLRVITYNAEGVVSDPRGIMTMVYGDSYKEGLKPRKWGDQTNDSPTSIALAFDEAAEDEVGVWIVFVKTGGEKDSVMMVSTATAVQISDIDTEKPYYYYSVFKPEENAIDHFYSDPVDLQTALMLDFKKENWIIEGFSGEASPNGAVNLIDNDISTSWHSEATAAFPHWVSIDMGSSKLIDGFYYVNHQGNAKSAKNVRIETSEDNTAWTVVLETIVSDNYLRQRLPLSRTVTARYFRVTVLDSWDPAATQTQFAEIDAYNVQNLSGENGKDAYTNIVPVALVNAKAPFTGDGSNPFPALGDYRMQKVAGWTHSGNAIVSYDNNGSNFSLFTAAVWGLPTITNGKVYQTVNLQPGHYLLSIESGSADGPVDIYGVAAITGSLPDYADVPSSSGTLKYVNLMDTQNETAEVVFTVTEASPVNIGVVYNIRDQYNATGLPWSSFTLKGFELAKVD